MNPPNLLENIEQKPLREFTEKAYLDYSMYVILDRALPHIVDGLKPVQRRIIYAMSELGLKATAKFKKSARTIGDVLGKYHPHGDIACYEAMVIMAQPFAYRYPLIDGQGNWGSSDDPKSFAAMRYTEARMTAYSELLLKELGQGTVNWAPNFDGTLEEPTLLPARLPNILLNGTTGIAVGMTTDIPPHNLREVASACVRLLEDPKATLKNICEHIQGPDFPTGAEIITPRDEIIDMYENGTGSLRMRATYLCENDDIIITALPYQTSGAKVQEQIAEQMQTKKLPMISDLRDESDHENPTRLVITLRSNYVNIDELMAHLFATTDLECTYRVNINVIGTNGRPQVKGLMTILTEWLTYRIEIVKRRLQYRLDQVLQRLHILEGLMIVYLNVDEVIAIIRKEDQPKQALITRFKLSETQTEAILELKLRHLAKLEEMRIRGEQEELEKERKILKEIIASNHRLRELVRDEIAEDAKKYGDDRRSPIVVRKEAKAISEEKILPTEQVTVVLSQKGWVRLAKGYDIDAATLSYKSGDEFKMIAQGYSNQLAIFLDSTGRSYGIMAHTLPPARSYGEPLTSRLTPPLGANFIAVLMAEPTQEYLFTSDAGYGFITKLEELQTKNRHGKVILKLPKGARFLVPQLVTNYETQYLAAVTTEGRLLLFPLAYLPQLSRGKGNKIIHIPSARLMSREEYMVDLVVLDENDSLTLHSSKRHLTLKPIDLSYYQGERGRRGNKLPRGFRCVERMTVSK